MSFQSVVNRNYTPGFAGEIANDGPTRAIIARITSASGNAIALAYGYSGEVPVTGITDAAEEKTVEVGGAVFAGVLGNPKHYVRYGTSSGGPLDASYSLPQGAEGEFFDMAIMFGYLYNETNASKTVAVGDQIAYVLKTITGGQNPYSLPVGALVSVTPGSAAPAGMALIPNAFVRNGITIAASAANAPASGLSKIQLTQ